MFHACIFLFSHMGTNLGQMPAAAAKNSSRNSGYGVNILFSTLFMFFFFLRVIRPYPELRLEFLAAAAAAAATAAGI